MQFAHGAGEDDASFDVASSPWVLCCAAPTPTAARTAAARAYSGGTATDTMVLYGTMRAKNASAASTADIRNQKVAANDVINRRHTRRHHVPPSRLFKVLQAHVGWLWCVSRAHISPRGRCALGNASLKRRFRVEGTNCRVGRHSFARYAHRDGVKGRRRGRSLRVSTRKRVRVVIRIV